jgi:hypothetical protein
MDIVHDDPAAALARRIGLAGAAGLHRSARRVIVKGR